MAGIDSLLDRPRQIGPIQSFALAMVLGSRTAATAISMIRTARPCRGSAACDGSRMTIRMPASASAPPRGEAGQNVRQPMGGSRSKTRRGRSPKPARPPAGAHDNEACTGERAKRGRETASSCRRQAKACPKGRARRSRERMRRPPGRAAGPSVPAGGSPNRSPRRRHRCGQRLKAVDGVDVPAL